MCNGLLIAELNWGWRGMQDGRLDPVAGVLLLVLLLLWET
jgi:hypothetical protein